MPTHDGADERHKRRGAAPLVAHLVVITGPDRGASFPITRSGARVGSSARAELTLRDASVAPLHAELAFEGDAVVLRDLGSADGIHFAGARIRAMELEAGVEFSLGATRLRFERAEETDTRGAGVRHFGRVGGVSGPMLEVMALMERVSPSELSVLIAGETGTGKERLARSIHEASKRASGPYVVLDCSSIPQNLAESAMFGHEKGAFTGAVSTHRGVFEQADGGTIFLDEVGELDLSLQPKLLRVLEARELTRVGGTEPVGVDVRVIAATNRDLARMVAEGTFREDLYFRLSVVQCAMPALRERVEDIAYLAGELLEGFAGHRPELGLLSLSRDAVAALEGWRWPGNVRELKNVLERAVSLADSAVLEAADLGVGPELGRELEAPPPEAGPSAAEVSSPSSALLPELQEGESFKEAKQRVVDAFERVYLVALLERTAGNLSRASREIGLTRYHLRELLKKHALLDAFRAG